MPAPPGTIFVLTSQEDKRETPVAVVDNEAMADQWLKQDPKNNWIPFAMNDLSLTGITGYAPFKPQEKSVTKVEEERRNEQAQQLEQMKQLVTTLQENNNRMKKLLQQRGVLPRAKSSLLRSASLRKLEAASGLDIDNPNAPDEDIDDPVCYCGHKFYDHGDRNCDICGDAGCSGFDPKPTKDQVLYAAERRCFDRVGKKENPFVFQRHDGEMVLKVWLDGNKVGKLEWTTKGKDGKMHTEERKGWQEFWSILQSFGD